MPGASKGEIKKLSTVKLIIYIALFVLNILTVIGYVHFLISLAVTVAAMLIMDRKSFKKADYNLLLTFVFFFVLIGKGSSEPIGIKRLPRLICCCCDC